MVHPCHRKLAGIWEKGSRKAVSHVDAGPDLSFVPSRIYEYEVVHTSTLLAGRKEKGEMRLLLAQL